MTLVDKLDDLNSMTPKGEVLKCKDKCYYIEFTILCLAWEKYYCYHSGCGICWALQKSGWIARTSHIVNAQYPASSFWQFGSIPLIFSYTKLFAAYLIQRYCFRSYNFV